MAQCLQRTQEQSRVTAILPLDSTVNQSIAIIIQHFSKIHFRASLPWLDLPSGFFHWVFATKTLHYRICTTSQTFLDLKMAVFCDFALCILVHSDRSFRGTEFLHHQASIKMKYDLFDLFIINQRRKLLIS